MYHLELHSASEIDDEVRSWHQEAWEACEASAASQASASAVRKKRPGDML